MKTHSFIRETPVDNTLKGVLEPLASYICAADRPRAALLSAYKALLSEVEQTNRTASAHFGIFAQGR